jgi:hypothetical protein
MLADEDPDLKKNLMRGSLDIIMGFEFSTIDI